MVCRQLQRQPGQADPGSDAGGDHGAGRGAIGRPANGGTDPSAALSPRDVVRVDVKRFHRVRSASLIAAVAAATTILVIEAVRSGNPGTPEPPGGGGGERLQGHRGLTPVRRPD